MPTSVLLAVLAAAGLLALAPALVRRYDATERLVAERTLSTARVIERRRRQRTVPGRRPVNPPRSVSSGATSSPSVTALVGFDSGPRVAARPVSGAGFGSRPVSGAGVGTRPVPSAGYRSRPVSGAGFGSGRDRRQMSPAVYRRRRVLAALVLLNVSELCGVGLLGPGFWISSAPSLALLGAYLVHLRNRALRDQRRRREAVRRAVWLRARQEEVRLEQARRLAARREVLRRAAAARASAQRDAQRLSQRYVDGSIRSAVRGRPYESRASGY